MTDKPLRCMDCRHCRLLVPLRQTMDAKVLRVDCFHGRWPTYANWVKSVRLEGLQKSPRNKTAEECEQYSPAPADLPGALCEWLRALRGEALPESKGLSSLTEPALCGTQG